MNRKERKYIKVCLLYGTRREVPQKNCKTIYTTQLDGVRDINPLRKGTAVQLQKLNQELSFFVVVHMVLIFSVVNLGKAYISLDPCLSSQDCCKDDVKVGVWTALKNIKPNTIMILSTERVSIALPVTEPVILLIKFNQCSVRKTELRLDSSKEKPYYWRLVAKVFNEWKGQNGNMRQTGGYQEVSSCISSCTGIEMWREELVLQSLGPGTMSWLLGWKKEERKKKWPFVGSWNPEEMKPLLGCYLKQKLWGETSWLLYSSCQCLLLVETA